MIYSRRTTSQILSHVPTMRCFTRLFIPTIQQFSIQSMAARPPNTLPLPARGALTLGKWSGLVQHLAGPIFSTQRTMIHTTKSCGIHEFSQRIRILSWERTYTIITNYKSLSAHRNSLCTSMPCPSDGMHARERSSSSQFSTLAIIASSPNNNVLVPFDDRFEFPHDQPDRAPPIRMSWPSSVPLGRTHD